MPTAVIYARFSCSKQREASIDDQLRVCAEYCQREGYSVVRHYCDYAVSGRTDDRPQFQEMIANAGESDLIVVYMMDRFSRDPYDAPIYKKQLAKSGVRVVSAMEYVDESPEGIIMEKLLEGLAARESMVTSLRTRRGMEGNAKKCLYNGYPVFGYKVGEDGHYVVDELQAALVREAFERRQSREAVNSIATDFAKRGVTTKRGKPCTYSMVNNMLHNERYTGVYIWDDVRVDGGMPAIISRDVFDSVQSVRGKKVRKEEVFAEYALSGKAICGNCGHNLAGSSCHNKLGNRYDYYRCTERCGARMVQREAVEGRIVDELRAILDSDEAFLIAQEVEKAWKRSNTHKAKDEALERLRKAQEGKRKLIAAVEDGMPYSAIRERFEQLSEMEIRAQSDYELHKHDDDFSVEDFVDFLRFGATLDDSTLLGAFVRQVVVFDDRLLVTLSYNDKKANTPRQLDLEVFAQVQSGAPNRTLYTHFECIAGSLYLVVPMAA